MNQKVEVNAIAVENEAPENTITYNHVVCPNCGRSLPLVKASGKWERLDHLDALEAMIAVFVPLLLVALTAVSLHLFRGYLPHGLMNGWGWVLVCLAVFGAAFVVTGHVMIRVHDTRLSNLGVSEFHISCSCHPRNSFVVIRPVPQIRAAVPEEMVSAASEAKDNGLSET